MNLNCGINSYSPKLAAAMGEDPLDQREEFFWMLDVSGDVCDLRLFETRDRAVREFNCSPCCPGTIMKLYEGRFWRHPDGYVVQEGEKRLVDERDGWEEEAEMEAEMAAAEWERHHVG